MTQFIKLCYRNILETGTVTVTTENTLFPKYRLYNRDIGKLFKGTAFASPFAIKVDQGAVISYPVDRLIIPAGHNLNGLACSLRYSTDDFASDDHEANGWTQSDALFIDKEILDVTGSELISNGGMEEGDPPTGWSALSTPEIFERSAVQKHSGSYSAHIVDSTASYGAFQQLLVNKVAGKTYKLCFWYYIVSGTMAAYFYRGDGGGLIAYQLYTTTGSWQYAELIGIETVTGNSGGPRFLNASNSIAAEFFIDDVSIKEMILHQTRAGGTNLYGACEFIKANVKFVPDTVVLLSDMQIQDAASLYWNVRSFDIQPYFPKDSIKIAINLDAYDTTCAPEYKGWIQLQGRSPKIFDMIPTMRENNIKSVVKLLLGPYHC